MNADQILTLGAIALSLLVFGVLGFGFFLVVRDTIRGKGKWGVNVKPVHCPSCGEPAPAVRKPQNRRQTLWGGCTCTRCGTEYDKWGQPVPEEN